MHLIIDVAQRLQEVIDVADLEGRLDLDHDHLGSVGGEDVDLPGSTVMVALEVVVADGDTRVRRERKRQPLGVVRPSVGVGFVVGDGELPLETAKGGLVDAGGRFDGGPGQQRPFPTR